MVSIIVPVYNVEKYLTKCVESLVNQTYSDIEILLVNDGSKDNSGLMCEEFAQKYEKVTCLNKVNGGLSDARNYGLKYAKGDYVLFIDSDDWVDVTMVEKMMAKAQSVDADIVCSDMEYVDENDVHTFSDGGQFDWVKVEEHPEIISINHSACNKMYRKSLFDSIQFPKGLWYEDLATIPLCMYAAKVVAKVNEPLYFYFQRSGSISHTKNAKIFDIYTALKTINEVIGKSGDIRFSNEIKKMMILNGADMTTLRIKDYDSDREEFLRRNVDLLEEIYPDWQNDPQVKNAGFKKKIMYFLLKHRQMKLLLKCFH